MSEAQREKVPCCSCGCEVEILESAVQGVKPLVPKEIGMCGECGALLVGGSSVVDLAEWAASYISGPEQRVVTIIEAPVKLYGREFHLGCEETEGMREKE